LFCYNDHKVLWVCIDFLKFEVQLLVMDSGGCYTAVVQVILVVRRADPHR
jgi:hypothetical protein